MRLYQKTLLPFINHLFLINSHCMAKYLLFDADMTLYDFKATEAVALRRVFEKNNIPWTDEMFSLYQEGNHFCWDQYEKGLMTQEKLKGERFRIFCDKLDNPGDPEVAGDDYVDFLAEAGIMIPGAIPFLESIKDRGKSIVTNGIAKTQHGRIDRTDTRKYFDHIFISQEMGVAKPEKAFFDHVLSVIGKRSDECIVIGDSDKSDIQGAINASMDSIFIDFSGKKSERATYSVSSFEELSELLKTI